jgi:hypothetical protein
MIDIENTDELNELDKDELARIILNHLYEHKQKERRY